MCVWMCLTYLNNEIWWIHHQYFSNNYCVKPWISNERIYWNGILLSQNQTLVLYKNWMLIMVDKKCQLFSIICKENWMAIVSFYLPTIQVDWIVWNNLKNPLFRPYAIRELNFLMQYKVSMFCHSLLAASQQYSEATL